MALPRGLPSETKQGPEDRRGQFNEGTSPGGGGSAQSLERGRAAWGRPEVQPTCPDPGWGAQGTTPYLPSHLPLSLLLGKPTGGQHAEQAEKSAWRGSGKAPLERAAPPRHPFPRSSRGSLFHVCLCAGSGALLTAPLAGTERTAMPAEHPAVLTQGEDAAPAASEGHPFPAGSRGTSAAGVRGPDQAASGGCAPWAGGSSPATGLLRGTVQAPHQCA